MCLEAHDSEKLLRDLHDGPARGHFTSNTKMDKVMWDGLYWLTLFIDSHAYASKSPVYQRCVDKNKKSFAPLQPIAMEEPFQKWSLDIIGEIFPHSSKDHHYILIATYYFM